MSEAGLRTVDRGLGPSSVHLAAVGHQELPVDQKDRKATRSLAIAGLLPFFALSAPRIVLNSPKRAKYLTTQTPQKQAHSAIRSESQSGNPVTTTACEAFTFPLEAWPHERKAFRPADPSPFPPPGHNRSYQPPGCGLCLFACALAGRRVTICLTLSCTSIQ